MNILQVVPTRCSAFGGPVRVVENIKGFITKEGDDVRIFPNHDEETRGRWFTPDRNAISRLKACVKWADVVHIHGLWTFPTTYAAHVARSTSTPYMINPHGMLDVWQLEQRKTIKKIYSALIEKKSLKKAAAVCFTHLEEMDEANNYMDFSNAFIMPNPVDVSAFKDLPQRVKLNQLYPQVSGKIVLFFMARIHHKKGLDILIDACAKLDFSLRGKFHMLVAGEDEGDYFPIIKDLVAKHRLHNNITFVGEVLQEKKDIILGGADIFALISRQEGDSIALKEAMASGLALLASRQCHYPEWEPEGLAKVVSTDIQEVSFALGNMIADPERLKKMGLRAKEYAGQHFSINTVYKNLRDGYHDLVEGERESCCWLEENKRGIE